MNKTILVAACIVSLGFVISAIILATAMGHLGEDMRAAGASANPAHSTFVVKLANWDDGLRLKPIELKNHGGSKLRIEHDDK